MSTNNKKIIEVSNYKLRAIPEGHPVNIVTDKFKVLRHFVGSEDEWMSTVKDGLLDYFVEEFVANPSVVSDIDFMNDYKKKVIDAFVRNVNPRFYQISEERTNEMISKQTKYIQSDLEIARGIGFFFSNNNLILFISFNSRSDNI